MRRTYIAAAILLLGFTAFAADPVDLGSSRYLEPSVNGFYDLLVTMDQDGTVHLLAQPYDYALTPAEKDRLTAIVSAGSRLLDIAATNKTTVDFQKLLGEVYMSISNGRITADFRTAGWQQSYVVLTIFNGGQNRILQLSKAQTDALLSNLNKAGDAASDLQKQLALFQ